MGDHDQLNKGTNHVAETKMAGSSPSHAARCWYV
jgi:hypothetical protein